MGLEHVQVREIVERAVAHKWGIPEFQRGFVWTPQKVRDLMDSLWRGYPIGALLIWYGGEYGETRTAQDYQPPDAWIVDGQQRTVALCLLFGRKPYWWDGEWNQMLTRHDVCFNVLAETEPFFSLRTATMKGPAGRPWVSVRDVLNADDDRLSEIVSELLKDLGLPANKFGYLWTRLDGVRRVRDAILPVITVMMDLEDVTEIFARLNNTGTKVTEADIALALVCSENPGWARTQFLPFLEKLADAGFEIDPNVVFRSCVGIGLKRARLKQVPRAYWKSDALVEAWDRTEKAWMSVVHYLENHGILSDDVLPTKNALITMVILADAHPEVLGDDRLLAWLLHATRVGRYSGAAMTALETDLQIVQSAATGREAWANLTHKLGPWEPFVPQDFLQDYRDRFLRLIMYLVMYDRGARDWVSRQRLGFHGTELLERFRPDWHHIFPRAYIRKHLIPEEKWDVFANIAVMAPSTNIRFGSGNPMGYLERYQVDDDLLAEQFVPTDRSLLTIEHYEEFLSLRAAALADAANRYFQKLLGETK